MAGRRIATLGATLLVAGLGVSSARMGAAALPAIAIEAFPVGAGCQKYVDTWHDTRSQGLHEGIDILAPLGTPLYAVKAGTVSRMRSNTLGGISLRVTTSDGSYFYYAHLSRYAYGLVEGQAVAAGQVIGHVGRTGDAGIEHLHFEVHPAVVNKIAVNPYPIVRALAGCGMAAATVDGRSQDYTPPGYNGTTTTTAGSTGGSGGSGSTTTTTVAGPPARAGGGLRPTTPTRLMDTRNAGPYTRLSAGRENFITLAGRGGVSNDATIAVLNLTVTSPSGSGYLVARPCGAPTSLTSSVNFTQGETVASGVIVGVGTSGRVCFMSNTDVDLIVDVTGSSGPTGAFGFTGITPQRLLDTRDAGKRAVGGKETIVKVPTTGAAAATANITVVHPSGTGYVTVYPCKSTRPTTSTLNFSAGEVIANSTTVGLNSKGEMCLFSTVNTDLVVDLMGTWSSDAKSIPVSITPKRLVDTRNTGSRPDEHEVITVKVAGTSGVPAAATGALVTVTVTDPIDAGYVTLWPCGQAKPTASNLNYRAGEVVANSAIVRLGTGGAICVASSAAAHTVVDLTGYLS